jgi:ABC-type transport system involved in multi-copper enzyme maturation permease subunit
VRTLRYEWKLLARQGVFWTLLILLWLCSCAAIWQGRLRVAQWERRQQELAVEETSRLQKLAQEAEALKADGKEFQALKDPRDPSEVGRRLGTKTLLLPSPPLFVLSVGVSDLWANIRLLSTDRPLFARENSDLDEPEGRLHGPMDGTFVVIVLLPVVLILLGYDYWSAEAESGRLLLILSSTSAARIFMTRLLLRWFLLVLPMLSLLVGAAVLQEPQALSRALAWGVIALVSTVPWLGLIVWVGSLGRSSSWNLLVLAGIWSLSLLVIPGFLQLFLSRIAPTPSMVETVLAVRQEQQALTWEKDDALKEIYVDHPEMQTKSPLPRAERSRLRFTAAERAWHAARPKLEELERALLVRESLAKRWSYLSPSLIGWECLSHAAGVSRHRYIEFHSQADQALEQWNQFFRARVFSAEPFHDYTAIPSPVWREWDWRLGSLGKELLFQIGLGGLLLLLGLRRIRKMERGVQRVSL